MACHTWALSGSTVSGAGETVNKMYVSLMDEIGKHYEYGQNFHGKTLTEIRKETMEKIALIGEGRKKDLHHEIYLCGGFREGQVCPEHLWLEDRTAKRTYDTFIDQEVVSLNSVGTDGEAFAPGCEEDDFEADEIARVPMNGYTEGQYNSLPTD